MRYIIDNSSELIKASAVNYRSSLWSIIVSKFIFDTRPRSLGNEFIEKFIANPQKCDYIIWLVTL